MVVKTRKEFDLLGADTMVDGVIEDEDVDTICARQGCNGRVDDGCSEQCGEPAPMDVAGVHEAVEGMIAVMRECSHIAKNGTNSFRGYTYGKESCSDQAPCRHHSVEAGTPRCCVLLRGVRIKVDG